MATPRGIRNNNPLNLRYVAGITSTYAGVTGKDDAGFCIFDTPQHGIQGAARALLIYQDKHALNTIAGIIARWAPPSENDTAAYITAISNAIGIPPDMALDLHGPAVMVPLVTAMIQHENGQQPYDSQTIASGVNAALGIKEEPVAEPTPSTAPSWIDAIGPIAGALNPIAGLIVTAFSPLLKEKLAKALAKHTDSPDTAQQVSDNIIAAAQKVTGIADPVQAAATIASKSNPEQVAQVEQSTSDLLDKIAPLLDKLGDLDKARWEAEIAGRDAAAKRAQLDRWDMTPVLVWFAAVTSTLLAVGLTGAVAYQALTGQDINVGLIGLAGPIAMGALQSWRDIFAYRFDGSKQSEAQNAVLQTLASK